MNFAISSFVAAAALVTPVKEARVPRPSNEAVIQARSMAVELYKDRIAEARKPAEKSALSWEIVRVAVETQDDPAAQYFLLYAARNLAADAKDWPLTMESIVAIVERFLPVKSLSIDAWIKRGDDLCAEAKQKTGRQRLELHLWAAECYLYARRDDSGLQGRIADKRLAELEKTLGWPNKTDNDLKVLIGTWNVAATSGYHASWTFFADGTVRSTKGAKGTWFFGPGVVHISWGNKTWHKLHRPLNVNGTSVDSRDGIEIITAIKTVR